ncbi:MAG: efflux RND transporter periplasmic adaptor subunit [Elusimicrobiota bacterium]|jgi:multidrug efflux pump subunit AcrA (membrane-fusion protein)|nr:efflux RND transporter periplasmic adaptor subunit [Elusimicrobiota bacterium]
MKKISISLIIAVSAVSIFNACGKKDSANSLQEMETDRFSVQTETLQTRNISLDLLLTGSVKAWEEAVIFPRVDGKLLQNILEEGASVKRGQNIALIERDEVGAVYEPVVVPSTITGVIGRTYLDPGANVTKSTAIALAVNQDIVRILVEIPERYLSKIHVGQKATFTVEAYGDKQFEAEIYKLSPVVDTQSRVVKAELKADNKSGFIKSGMFAKVKLMLEKANDVPSLSLGAVSSEKDGNSYVFVVNGDRVAKTPVRIGLKSETHVQIKSGLSNGAQVAKIVFGLEDASKIKVENKYAR